MLLYNFISSQDKRNPFNDALPRVSRKSKILGKKAELYNKYSVSIHLKSRSKSLLTGTSKPHCQRRISRKDDIPNWIVQGLYFELILYSTSKVNGKSLLSCRKMTIYSIESQIKMRLVSH